MASESAWKAVRGQLSIANGDEFERTALHYLRIIWPSMIQAPRMQRLDRFGVDLCVLESDLHFDVAVQAKGFKIEEQLLESQVNKLILPSIEKFRLSPLSCDTYVLLHNRDGADRRLAGVVQVALDRLVSERKAKSVQLWDRDQFIKIVRNKTDDRIRDKLAKRSQTLRRDHERFFHFGHIFVPKVPLKHYAWRPGASVQPDFMSSDFIDTEAARLIASPREVRYALLIGSFGIGKTTIALRALDARDLLVVYVPAYAIRRDYGSQGTNYLLRNINDELDLLDDLPPDSAEVLRDVMGAALGRVLRQANDEYVLVIDGLDEHNFYGTPNGLQWLTNELSELRCPIVLTTRKEHFLALIGNYALAAEKLSRKGGADRTIDVLEMGPWSSRHAQELLQVTAQLVESEDHRASILRLAAWLNCGASIEMANLLSHPLLLQMTLDLIIYGEEWLVGDESALIELWVRKKIMRDLSVPRLADRVHVDAGYYVDGIIEAMGRIALEMRSEDSDMLSLSETIEVERALQIVREAVGIPDLEVTTALTTSLLVPASRRHGRVLYVKFFHRRLQEYFTDLAGLTKS